VALRTQGGPSSSAVNEHLILEPASRDRKTKRVAANPARLARGGGVVRRNWCANRSDHNAVPRRRNRRLGSDPPSFIAVGPRPNRFVQGEGPAAPV
jgi:hypothetical protein